MKFPLLSLAFVVLSASAQPVVEVSTARDPELKAYATMARGLDAFDASRAQAPQGTLRFLLRPATREDSLEGLELKIVGDTVTLPVRLDPDGGFTLPRSPAALADNAALVLNKKKHSFRWRPDVRSPGVPADARRLGDLRVQCAVQWAIDQADLAPAARGALAAGGGPCRSMTMHMGFDAPAPLRAAWLQDGARREAIPVSRHYRRVFNPPLADRSWSDDTLVRFEYAR
ncbi:hypothetical protein OU994_09065 [Pseudoduganella sp. SL102]|uniref:Uncharacterized protein n=1 Tax=Pseudoduganella albidiflava TaxID=321983 RepID=A0A411X253_9BURK|nr:MULTISPECIES: hypothetical protein [Pseudoduganella]QBI03070.1 hypothetical protein EYF70_21210 [Pseudoduganella albidiflava]WBS04412.1 hypothetical protein OU994_09065 [Pseudoduganella sp. SL102]GGY58793.1 hypothetical protein GCM10007387_46680 [Pseudoduganella albidiflava]